MSHNLKNSQLVTSDVEQREVEPVYHHHQVLKAVPHRDHGKVSLLYKHVAPRFAYRKRHLVRAYDIFLSLIILAVFLIPTLIVALIKIIADGNPLFYNSRRIGKNRNSFTVFKFRTMVNDRSFIENYFKKNKSYGFEKICVDCPLYTPTGRFFEKFQIVEILQIFNVLSGTMSIIGYRPLPVTHVQQLEEELGHEKVALRHSVLPGITGISQIVGKLNLTNEERVDVENAYNMFVHTQSEWKIITCNTLIIFETIARIILKKNLFMNHINKILDPLQTQPAFAIAE